MNQQKTGLTEINETSSKMCSNLEVLLFCIHVPFVVKKKPARWQSFMSLCFPFFYLINDVNEIRLLVFT